MGTVTVEVETDDVLDALADNEVAAEYNLRGLAPVAVARFAIDALVAAQRYDAATQLEREFFPKWKSVAECRKAYTAAMAVAA